MEGVNAEAVGLWEAVECLKSSRVDAVLVRLPFEDWTPEDMLEQIQRIDPATPVIFCDTEGRLPDAVRLTRLGAFHYMAADEAGELLEVLERAAAQSRSHRLTLAQAAGASEPWRKFLVGESQPIQHLARVIRLVGPRRSTILISGETGAGKEMVARAIHMASDRAHLPLVAVNCTALPENLLETELFGHVKGAFTGAITHRVGRFEQAHRGTLFLDEVGDLPMDIQAKLLRVLQEREFQRIGSSETVKVDVRVIAASNIDLAQAVRVGKFREDLYYRLNVVPLRVPALRERPSDIPLLVRPAIGKRHGNGDRPERRSRNVVSCGFCASSLTAFEKRSWHDVAHHLPAGRRPRLRGTRRQYGARHSRAGAPQDGRQQGAGGRNAPVEAYNALGQVEESSALGVVARVVN